MNGKISKAKVEQEVNEREDSITKIIDPEDLTLQDVNSWDNVDLNLLKEELHTGLDEWHYMATHPYENLIQELAVSMFIDDMVRVPYDHLSFDSRNKCVVEGYWLYDMSKDEVLDIVNENKQDIEMFHEYESEAQSFIETCVVNAQVKDLEG